MLRLLIILVAVLLGIGCDSIDVPAHEPEVVVEGYLFADEQIGGVRLTQTVPVDERFNADSLGITGADVRIELVFEDGSIEESYQLLPVPGEQGIYRATEAAIVQPLRTYRLVATTPLSSTQIQAETTVPGAFQLIRVENDTTVFRSDAPPTAIVSRPPSPDRQNYFVLTTIALEPDVDMLTPFAKALFDDGEETLTSLSENVSPLLNEENFDTQFDGSLRFRYPWLGLNFFGPNRVVLNALDDNLFDFIRSQSVQQGGSTLPPGEIPNALTRVDGGRGVFGSASRVTIDFFVERN